MITYLFFIKKNKICIVNFGNFSNSKVVVSSNNCCFFDYFVFYTLPVT